MFSSTLGTCTNTTIAANGNRIRSIIFDSIEKRSPHIRIPSSIHFIPYTSYIPISPKLLIVPYIITRIIMLTR